MSDNIIEFIHSKAMEMYGDEQKADEFVHGFFTKVASLSDYVNLNAPTVVHKDTRVQESQLGTSIARGIGQTLGQSVAGAGAAVALGGLAKLYDAYKGHALYNQFLKALNEAIQMNRVLKTADKDKVSNFAHTIFKFAPHVATDANMLSSILANAIHGDGVDPMTIRTLTELEGRYQQTKQINIPGIRS